MNKVNQDLGFLAWYDKRKPPTTAKSKAMMRLINMNIIPGYWHRGIWINATRLQNLKKYYPLLSGDTKLLVETIAKELQWKLE